MYTLAHGKRQKPSIFYIIGACLIVFVATYAVLLIDSPVPETQFSTPQQQDTIVAEATSIGTPVRIIIPKIEVNAILEYVGLTADGEMDEPTDAENAAWYNRRPLPGEEGTAVVAGHFGYKDNKPAVFDYLDKLRKGDEIHVKDSNGTIIVFTVKESRTYTPEQDVPEVFGSDDGKSHLNLITCKGTWNESTQSYDSRLVVFADRTEL